MAVMIRLEHNDQECLQQALRLLGPFEWVQITYGILRVPEDYELAFMGDHGWTLHEDSSTWTDIIVYPEGD